MSVSFCNAFCDRPTRTLVSAAPKITDGRARFRIQTAQQIHSLYRAVLDEPGLTAGLVIQRRTRQGALKSRAFSARLLEVVGVESLETSRTPSHTLPAHRSAEAAENTTEGSIVYDADRNLLCVRCAQRTVLLVKKLVLGGRKSQNAEQFYRGYLSQAGTHPVECVYVCLYMCLGEICAGAGLFVS
jgi:methionyl-tRNA formyltransferase